MGCIIGEIGNDLESDPQNSLQEDFKVIVSEGNIKEGQTSDPRKTSADRRMIAIVDDEEFDRNLTRKRHPKYRKIHCGQSLSDVNKQRNERNDLIQIIGDSETIPQVDTHFSFFVYSFVGIRQV